MELEIAGEGERWRVKGKIERDEKLVRERIEIGEERGREGLRGRSR